MAISAEDILEAWRELGYPSATKLHQHLRNQGHEISLKAVTSFTRAQPVRQVFAKSPWNKKNAGQITALHLNDRWFGDLIQETSRSSNGFSWILAIQDVFSRKLYARPLRSKEPAQVAAALRSIFTEAGETPDTFETDGGKEFMGAVRTLLRQKGVEQHARHVLQRNVHATLDRAIASLRQTMSRLQVEERHKEWADVLDRAVKIYNKTVHSALGPATPNDVGESELLQRVMEKQQVQMSHQNALKAKQIRKTFEEAGAFRMPADNAHRQRGHKAKWGPAKDVEKGARPGKVEDVFDFKEFPIRQALPVQIRGPDVQVPQGLQGTRKVPQRLEDEMRAWVERNKPVTMKAFSDELRRLGSRLYVTQQVLKDFGLTKERGKWR
jgi:hypothetical protein